MFRRLGIRHAAAERVATHCSARGAPLPREVAAQLDLSFAARGFTSPTWYGVADLARAGFKVADGQEAVNVAVCNGSLPLWNIAQLAPLPIGTYDENAVNNKPKTPQSSEGIFHLSAVTGRPLPRDMQLMLSAAASLHTAGYQSRFWLTADTAASFGTRIKDGELSAVQGLEPNGQLADYFNAEQTVHPQHFTDQTCRPYEPRKANGRRFPVWMAWRFRAHALKHKLVLDSVWGTRHDFERLAVEILECAVPVEVSAHEIVGKTTGKVEQYFPAASTTNPKKLRDLSLLSLQCE